MRLLPAMCVASLSLAEMAFSPAVPPVVSISDRAVVPSEMVPVDEMIGAAAEMMDTGRWDDAIRTLTLVLEIQPGNGWAHANRAMAYGWTNRLEEASRDLAAAEKAIPGQAINHRVRAVLAERRSDEDTELSELSKSLEIEPGNPMALNFRAWLLQRKGREQEALNDADAFIRARPDDPDGHALKARLLLAQQKRDLAGAQAQQMAGLFPGDAYAMSTAASIHAGLGDRSRAMQEISRAIAEDPDSSEYYRMRAKFRRWDDVAGRRKDLEAALELQADDLSIITELALLDFQEQRWSAVISETSLILTLEPKDFGILAYRAMAREKLGDRANAERDYSAAMAAASGAGDFDLICDTLGFQGIALDKALAACNRAVELDGQDGYYRGTRGLVQLRLGRLDDALADFDFAIAADKRIAHPFYGRALTRWRKGDRSGALEDLARARSIAPQVDEKFRKHGFVDLPER